MTRGEAWLLHLANILTAGTGLAYAFCIYLLPPMDEFSNVGSPWQPHLQSWHIIVSPLLVFAVAMIWKTHAMVRLRQESPRRRTGWIMLLSLFPMVLSGSMVQVATDPLWHDIWRFLHLGVSMLWVLGYLWHQFTRARPR